MRWQLSQVMGRLGQLSAAEALARVSLIPDEGGQCRIEPSTSLRGPALLRARVEPLLDTATPNWLILPHAERQRRHWWQAQVGPSVAVGFGRAAVVLALSQLNRLGTRGRLIAADGPTGNLPGVEGVLALEWTPAEYGLAFDLTHVDGRVDGKTELGSVLELGRQNLAQPEVLFCPGTGAEGYLERLLPFLVHLGPWARQGVRWEFAEASVGCLGVVGSLYNWAWIEAGYRLGDWTDPCAVMELDESPLAGLSVINWSGGVDLGRLA